jgi:hypothetical protein
LPSERHPAPMLPPVPFKIVQNPGLTVILFEEFNRFRQIFTDGRRRPNVEIPSWWGYSTAAWDGDTFVVDTPASTTKHGWTKWAIHIPMRCTPSSGSDGSILDICNWN